MCKLQNCTNQATEEEHDVEVSDSDDNADDGE